MEYRYVEVLINNEWIRKEFIELRKGDIFKLYEPDGSLVNDPLNRISFEAERDAYYNSDGIPCIQYNE